MRQANFNPLLVKMRFFMYNCFEFGESDGLIGVVNSMADPMTPEGRSHQMSLVKSHDTKPETELKRLFWRLGFHYRYSNWSKLPGKPDLVFIKRKKVVFLHGCFWHRHETCHNGTRIPKSNVEFWVEKLNRNAEHDKDVYNQLAQLGWQYLIIWECEMKKSNYGALTARIRDFMAE